MPGTRAVQTEGDSCRPGDRSGVRDKGTGGLSFGLETRARWRARHRQTACPKEPLQGDKGSTPRRQRQLAERTRSSEEQPAGGTEMGQLLQQGTHVRSAGDACEVTETEPSSRPQARVDTQQKCGRDGQRDRRTRRGQRRRSQSGRCVRGAASSGNEESRKTRCVPDGDNGVAGGCREPPVSRRGRTPGGAGGDAERGRSLR